MAAYAAVISLKHTINGLLNSSRISLVSSTHEILESAYNETTSLLQVLERSNSSSRSRSRSRSSNEKLDGLEGQIGDFAQKLEDVLDFHELSSDEDEEVMRQEITSFGAAAKKMEKDYVQELSRDDDDDDDDAVLPRTDFGVEMVGHSKLFTYLKDYILKKMRPDELWFYAFWGEHGSGRTMVANTIFEDLRKGRKQFFDCCVWVTVSPKHKLKEVLIRFIAQADNLAAEADYESLISQEDEKLSKYLYKLLEKQRYMIMLDDVDDVQLVNYLRNKSFPDQSNGSLVILTTTSKEVALLADKMHSLEYTSTYFEECMWSILCHCFFGFESFSQEQEVLGKKIIRNCHCRLIAFVKALMFLFKSDVTAEQWSKIAADEENSIFMVGDELSEIRQIKIEMQYYNTEIVGLILPLVVFSGDIVKMKIHPERFFSKMQIISFYGMAGIGKTTFVSNLFKDKSVLSHFDHHVWITLGSNYRTEDILFDILAQIYPDSTHMKGDDKIVRNLCEGLSCKRCLIVLDDLWSTEPLLHLKNLFPNIKGTTFTQVDYQK